MDSSSPLAVRLREFAGPLLERLRGVLAGPAAEKTTLITALVVLGLLCVLLVATVLFMPSKRKVVRKRRVRRVRRKVVGRPAAAGGTESTLAEAGSALGVAAVAEKPAARSRRRAGAFVWALVWASLLVLSVVVAYEVTGSNRYCGETCHATNPHVVLAVKLNHADCIDCHEPDPISGVTSRVRMSLARAAEESASVVARPIDPGQCLECHENVASVIVRTDAGLIVSHKEILAGGRTCSDCHPDTGHRKGTSIVGGMSRCTDCHDGVFASRACVTCHEAGSPITVANPAKKLRSAFDYGPAVRAANRQCARCHGAERRCRACHNGLVLPHPRAFVEGGHARMSAFAGKERCFKCHGIAWCSNTGCHNAFSAHSETAWRLGHQTGTSEACGSCHIAWDGKGNWCDVCH